MPTTLPIPVSCPTVTAGVAAVSAPTGSPIYYRLVVPTAWIMPGKNVTFSVTSPSPINLGVYGPNPTVLGTDSSGNSTGRLRAPKIGQPDAMASSCQGNLASGTYYIVVRSGDNGPPSSQVSLMVTMSGWKIFG